mgnify:CR=1 FL=1
MPHAPQQKREHRTIIAGFGGQGVLTLGKLLCRASMREGKNVTYLPSYGSEVRGGTANCHVVVSPQTIFSPYVEEADTLIILNELSFDRFGDSIRPDGLFLLNSSLVDAEDSEHVRGVRFLPLPATRLATEMGASVVANVVMLGAFLTLSGLAQLESAEAEIRELLSERKSESIPVNLKALRKGHQLAADMQENAETV